MMTLDILFVAVCAYLLCGWFYFEKNLSAEEKGVSAGKLFSSYYLWPVKLFKK